MGSHLCHRSSTPLTSSTSCLSTTLRYKFYNESNLLTHEYSFRLGLDAWWFWMWTSKCCAIFANSGNTFNTSLQLRWGSTMITPKWSKIEMRASTNRWWELAWTSLHITSPYRPSIAKPTQRQILDKLEISLRLDSNLLDCLKNCQGGEYWGGPVQLGCHADQWRI